jgi:hypothetical protein
MDHINWINLDDGSLMTLACLALMRIDHLRFIFTVVVHKLAETAETENW